MTAAGFRAKTGRAIVVVLRGEDDFVCRREVSLVDPAIAATAQPHHVVMELPWDEALAAAERTEAAIRNVAAKVIASLVKEHGIDCVGVAGSPDRDLTKLGNRHMRAHAAEGILFRRVIEDAARAAGLRCVSLSDREKPPQLDSLGKQAGRPWRADERIAANAAMRALSAPR